MGSLNLGNEFKAKEVSVSSGNSSNSAGGIEQQEKSIFLEDQTENKVPTMFEFIEQRGLMKSDEESYQINEKGNKSTYPDSKLTKHGILEKPDETFVDENGNKCKVYYNKDGSYQIERSGGFFDKIAGKDSIEQYDKDGNIVKKQVDGVIYSYNEDGSLAKTTNGNKVTTYNEKGDIETETERTLKGNGEYSVSKQYNEDGSYTQTTKDETWTLGGTTVKTKVQEFDKNGNPLSEAKVTTEYRDNSSIELPEFEEETDEAKDSEEDKTSELDADGDGIITQGEIDEYNKKQAEDKTGELDANGDGKITQDEIDAYNIRKKIEESIKEASAKIGNIKDIKINPEVSIEAIKDLFDELEEDVEDTADTSKPEE